MHMDLWLGCDRPLYMLLSQQHNRLPSEHGYLSMLKIANVIIYNTSTEKASGCTENVKQAV
jgi:hypothetical protein